MSKIYIHYGSKRFRPKLFKKIRNRDFFNKPDGGLWASPVNAEYGWKQWCEIIQTEMKLAMVQLPCWAERGIDDYRRSIDRDKGTSPCN